MKAYVCCYKNDKGEVFIRCKDGLWRKRPWMGTYSECMSFHTLRGAKRVLSNRMYRSRPAQFRFFKPGPDEQESITCAEIWQKSRENWGTHENSFSWLGKKPLGSGAGNFVNRFQTLLEAAN